LLEQLQVTHTQVLDQAIRREHVRFNTNALRCRQEPKDETTV